MCVRVCVCVSALEDWRECHVTYSVPGSGGACGQRGVCSPLSGGKLPEKVPETPRPEQSR